MTQRIEPIPGEYGRFYYHSDRFKARPEEGKMTYIMDLTGSRPECSCSDFTARCIGNWRNNRKTIHCFDKDGKKNPDRTYCKHIDELLKQISVETTW